MRCSMLVALCSFVALAGAETTTSTTPMPTTTPAPSIIFDPEISDCTRSQVVDVAACLAVITVKSNAELAGNICKSVNEYRQCIPDACCSAYVSKAQKLWLDNFGIDPLADAKCTPAPTPCTVNVPISSAAVLRHHSASTMVLSMLLSVILGLIQII